MKYPERFERAISSLVKGFFDGTLAKGTCTACAVGNIVAGAMGYKLTPYHLQVTSSLNSKWGSVIAAHRMKLWVSDDPFSLPQIVGGELIKITGYSIAEIDRIERAFESATKIDYKDYPIAKLCGLNDEIIQDQYNGLMAVVEVLCTIEEIADEPIKDLFAYDPKEFKAVNELIFS